MKRQLRCSNTQRGEVQQCAGCTEASPVCVRATKKRTIHLILLPPSGSSTALRLTVLPLPRCPQNPKPCPSCKKDASDQVNSLQVNHTMVSIIANFIKIQNDSLAAAAEEGGDGKEGVDNPDDVVDADEDGGGEVAKDVQGGDDGDEVEDTDQ